MGFSGPPSEPDVRLSPHPVLHLLMPSDTTGGIGRRPLVQLRPHREYSRLGVDRAGPRGAGIHQRSPRCAVMLRAHWTPSHVRGFPVLGLSTGAPTPRRPGMRASASPSAILRVVEVQSQQPGYFSLHIQVSMPRRRTRVGLVPTNSIARACPRPCPGYATARAGLLTMESSNNVPSVDFDAVQTSRDQAVAKANCRPHGSPSPLVPESFSPSLMSTS